MFSIIINETKDFLRDKTNLFFYIMFPVILIFLLGNLLGSIDKAEDTIGDIKIQYMIDTTDTYQVMAVRGFIKEAGKSNSLLKFEETKDLEEAKSLAGKDQITAAVAFTGNPMEVQIFEGTSQVKNRAVSAVFNSFVQTNKAISAVILTNPRVLTEAGNGTQEFVKQKDLGVERNMIDYYAVTMLTMICFMSILIGANAFMGERQNRTINRLIIAPQNRVFMFLQKILGMLPRVSAQIFIIMVTSVVFYKAHYAATLKANLYLFAMFFAFTLCMISIGAAIGLILKSNPMATVMPVLWIAMFIGGTYSKEMHFDGISDAMPNFQVQQAAFDLSVFGNYEKANFVIIISLLVMLAALAAGAWIFSRKEEER
jgi:ABC-2 type transport system permease protein